MTEAFGHSYACHVDVIGNCELKSFDETHLLSQSQGKYGMLIPVKSDVYDYIFMSDEVTKLEKKPAGLNNVIRNQLIETMKNMQKELSDKLSKVGTKRLSFIPEQECFQLWMKKCLGGDGNNGLFDREYKNDFLQRLQEMKELCSEVNIDSSWREFFERLKKINYAFNEVEMMPNKEEEEKFLALISELMESRQHKYSVLKTEFLPALDAAKANVKDENLIDRQRFVSRAKEYIEDGLELDDDVVEFLISELSADGNPLSLYDHTFLLPEDRPSYPRKGKWRKMSRAELEQQYLAEMLKVEAHNASTAMQLSKSTENPST